MIRLVADVNIDIAIVTSLHRQDPPIDIVRGQDVGLDGKPDEVVLEWAAANDRILLTHDRSTMVPLVEDRLIRSLPMSGVFLIRPRQTIQRVVGELVLISLCSEQTEWNGVIEFIFPFEL